MKKYAGEPYLRAEHLLKERRYISAKVTIEEVITHCPIKRGNKEAETIGLKFVGSEKVLGLNRTNEAMACFLCGEGTPEKWVGTKVTLVVRLVRNKKLNEPAIRIWSDAGHPNMRVREQMGEEITEAWYAKNMDKLEPKPEASK